MDSGNDRWFDLWQFRLTSFISEVAFKSLLELLIQQWIMEIGLNLWLDFENHLVFEMNDEVSN